MFSSSSFVFVDALLCMLVCYPHLLISTSVFNHAYLLTNKIYAYLQIILHGGTCTSFRFHQFSKASLRYLQFKTGRITQHAVGSVLAE